MSSEPVSLARAWEQEVGDGGAVLGADLPAEQLDLLRNSKGVLPNNVFQLVRDGVAAKRGPGRPKNSVNKRSQDLAKLLAGKYPDPVQFMAGLYAMPLDQLVELIKIADKGGKVGKRGDVAIKALNVQLAAAKSVAEYWHSKKPVEAIVRHHADAVLLFPASDSTGDLAAQEAVTRQASDIIARALSQGEITADMLIGLKLVDGRLIEGEYEEVSPE